MNKYREQYELEDDYQIIFTDGSVQEGKKSTGVGIVFDETEVAYKVSINKVCSAYTAEDTRFGNKKGCFDTNRLSKCM